MQSVGQSIKQESQIIVVLSCEVECQPQNRKVWYPAAGDNFGTVRLPMHLMQVVV